MPTDERDTIRDYLGVKEAAEFVGVSPATIRNWERAGKITARRNPMNAYRLFRRSDLEQLLEAIRRSDNPRTPMNSSEPSAE